MANQNDLFASMIDFLADAVAARLGKGHTSSNGAAKTSSAKTGGKTRKARKPLDMRCRIPGCKNRSKGPRFAFICADHLASMSKKQIAAATGKAA